MACVGEWFSLNSCHAAAVDRADADVRAREDVERQARESELAVSAPSINSVLTVANLSLLQRCRAVFLAVLLPPHVQSSMLSHFLECCHCSPPTSV